MTLTFGQKKLNLGDDNLTDFLLLKFREYEKQIVKSNFDSAGLPTTETLEWHANFLDFVLWLVENQNEEK